MSILRTSKASGFEKIIKMWVIIAVIGFLVGLFDMYLIPIVPIAAGWFFSPLISGFVVAFFWSALNYHY